MASPKPLTRKQLLKYAVMPLVFSASTLSLSASLVMGIIPLGVTGFVVAGTGFAVATKVFFNAVTVLRMQRDTKRQLRLLRRAPLAE